jgi:hypothetical protein
MDVRHVTDEELLLDLYGEATPEQRTAMRAHLQTCAECHALDRELRAVLALVDSEPPAEAPPGFERTMWARLEPSLANRVQRTPASWRFELPRWALAACVAGLAVGSFALGRVWDHSPSTPAGETATDARALSERVLRSEVEDHLERSQRVFLELVNADDAAPVVLASDRERAADLVAAGRLYRQSIEGFGDTKTRDLLEDVERVLVEIANGPEVETSNDLSEVRRRIANQDLIFRLRVTTAEMRTGGRRAGSTW